MMIHRSTENYSDKVRWSTDLRYQRPGDPTGYPSESKLPPMRKSDNPTYRLDWEAWTTGRTGHSEEQKTAGGRIRVLRARRAVARALAEVLGVGRINRAGISVFPGLDVFAPVGRKRGEKRSTRSPRGMAASETPRGGPGFRVASAKASASDAPIAMPRTSRRPWSLTATATVTATETMRPASRTFT